MILDPFVPPGTPLEPEVIQGMLDLGGLTAGQKHVDVGSGDGRVCAAAKARGASTTGIEIDADRAASSAATHGITVIAVDIEAGTGGANSPATKAVGAADLVTFWFTFMPATTQLLTLLRQKMRRGAKLVACFDSVGTGIIPHEWQPIQGGVVLGNKFWLYVK